MRPRAIILPRSSKATICAPFAKAIVALDQATRHFAELMMEAAVASAIRGKTMDAAGEELGDEVTAPHPMAPAEFK